MIYLITHTAAGHLVVRAAGPPAHESWGRIVHAIVQRLGESGEGGPVSMELGTDTQLLARHGDKFAAALARFAADGPAPDPDPA